MAAVIAKILEKTVETGEGCNMSHTKSSSLMGAKINSQSLWGKVFSVFLDPSHANPQGAALESPQAVGTILCENKLDRFNFLLNWSPNFVLLWT